MANEPTAPWSRGQLEGLVNAARANPSADLEGLVRSMTEPKYSAQQVRDARLAGEARGKAHALGGIGNLPAHVVGALAGLPSDASPEQRLAALQSARRGTNPWGR